MRNIVLTLLVAVLFIACSKDEDSRNLEGVYTGTFTRTDPSGGNAPTANVTLNLTETNFSGQSDVINYPAICTGSYTLEGNKVKVGNTCLFTPNFDGTLIFNGEYTYEFDGTNLKIWKEYSNGSKDIYVLRRKD